MKTLKLITAGLLLLASHASNAQVSVSLNIGTAPAWGPAGYSNVDYYYLPDVEAYYDIRASQFIYFGGGSWVRSRYLPRQYRNYDLYSGYKVVLNNYHGHRPYNNFNTHRRTYCVGYRGQHQNNIGYRTAQPRYQQKPSYSRNNRYDDNRRYADNRRNYNKHENKGRDNRHGGNRHNRD
ncbi:hypothetical protein [Flavobacterium sp.]|uniref:hypothetical protein n=1 Tax=Flavobacterium sp. TaxID=239 RepID=UPI00261184DC|nr:hypothetical protein [Flavobacterium sp.]MDG2432398.1 hypothetical protein [Flavobacterium sp.]